MTKFDSTKQEPAEEAEEIEVTKVTEESADQLLTPDEWWHCAVCGHIERKSKIRCGACQYYKAPSIQQKLEAISPVVSHVANPSAGQPADEQDILNLALERLQKLFIRAQNEGHTLSVGDRAELFENLLISMLKIERAEARRSAQRAVFEDERDKLKRKHMRHLSLIWFLGICTGFLLYFGLQTVTSLP